MLAVWLQIFRAKKYQKKAPCKCLSIVMLGSVIKAKKKYYPQKPFEECKYEQENITMESLINDDLEKGESDGSDRDANEEGDE